MQWHPLAHVAGNAGHYLRLFDGSEYRGAGTPRLGFGAHRGGRQRFADRGYGIAGAILGAGQGRGLLSHFLRLADFCGLVGHAIRAAPRPADDVARARRGWMKWTIPRWTMREILMLRGFYISSPHYRLKMIFAAATSSSGSSRTL